MNKSRKIILYVTIAIMIVGGGVIAKNKLSSAEVKKETATVTSNKIAVEVTQAKIIQKNLGMTYKANLEPYQEGIISSKLSAKVTQVNIENGKYVSQGDTLIVLDNQDIKNQIESAQGQLKISESQLNAAQVSLQKLQTNLDNAQRTYDRKKTLFEQGAIAKTEFEDAETAVKNAKVDLDTANANIETSKSNIDLAKINISNLQENLDNTTIKAPFSGVIEGKNVSVGQMASAGVVLAKINDISSVYATIQVKQEDINNIKVNQAAKITVDGGEEKSYDGKVKSIDAAADIAARVFTCKIQIDNSDKSLYPGIFAKAQLVNETNTEVLALPLQSLAGNEGDYHVLVNDNNVAKKKKVTIGETEENMVEIKSGLESGEEIITTNLSTLQDGDEIEISK